MVIQKIPKRSSSMTGKAVTGWVRRRSSPVRLQQDTFSSAPAAAASITGCTRISAQSVLRSAMTVPSTSYAVGSLKGLRYRHRMYAPDRIPSPSSLPFPPFTCSMTASSFSLNLCKGIDFITSSLLFGFSWYYYRYASAPEKVTRPVRRKK